MEILDFDFVRDAKPFSIFNLSKPNITYSLINPSGQNLKIEFAADINCTIIDNNEKVFYCGPPKRKISFGEIIISDRNLKKIGWIDYWGWTFKRKKIIIDDASRHEEWILKKRSVFSREFWSSNSDKIIIENGERAISLERTGNNGGILRINFTHNFNDDFLLMCGLIIYMYELRESDLRGR